MRNEDSIIEGRNVVIEALKSDTTVDRVFVQKDLYDGPIRTVIREAKKRGIEWRGVEKSRLDEMSVTGHHQGVIAYIAAYEYKTIDDMLALARERHEDPFIILLDEIEDPHNLGAIIRTANQVGAHGVVIPKHRAVGLTSTVARASSGAINYTPVAKVSNMSQTIEELKKSGLWIAAADSDGELMYDISLSGPMALVIGNEGKGIGPLIKKHCDIVAAIPMKGDIDSLNASVACGVLAYEVLRQRMELKKRHAHVE